MPGEFGLKLIKDIQRDPLGAYNHEQVAQTQREIITYFNEHLKILSKYQDADANDEHTASPEEFALFSVSGIVVERNLRYLLTYHHHRLHSLIDIIFATRAHGAGKLPPPKEIRERLSHQEVTVYSEICQLVHRYKSNFDDIVDLTGNLIPPVSTFIHVRALKDLDFETEDGRRRKLVKGHTDYLKRSDVEQFIEQGYLVHVL